MEPKVIYEEKGAVRLIALNSPETRNAMDKDLGQALADALERAAGDPRTRAVVLTGRGRAFSAGANVMAMKAEMDRSGLTPGGVLEKYVRIFTGATRTIRDMDAPVIAAVNGAASGGGLVLAMVCDLVVAAENAVFDPAYVRLGLVPVGGMSLVLAGLLGVRRAAEYLFMAEPVKASRALEMGLINRVAAAETCLDEALKLAADLAARPGLGIARTKRLLNGDRFQNLDEQVEREIAYLHECGDHPDHAAMLEALIAKLT